MDVETFEKEYVEILEKKGLVAAKEHFRKNFRITCFRCGHLGTPKVPMNCEKCGTYLD